MKSSELRSPENKKISSDRSSWVEAKSGSGCRWASAASSASPSSLPWPVSDRSECEMKNLKVKVKALKVKALPSSLPWLVSGLSECELNNLEVYWCLGVGYVVHIQYTYHAPQKRGGM